MLIREMTGDECRLALKQAEIGRLGCTRGDQPYIVPIYFSYDDPHLYGITTVGQKIEWMRSNPRVCVEIDEWTNHYRWMSVIAFGRYEELPESPDHSAERSRALEILQKREMWWDTACAAGENREQGEPVLYRIRIERMTGHRATPDALEAAALGAQDAPARR